MKIDFKNFSIKKSVASTEFIKCDVRERFADVLYKGVNGIRAHALAMKIFKSDGPTDYTYEEVMMIKRTAENFCTPAFIDGLRAQISE
jgi:hypothetical protein